MNKRDTSVGRLLSALVILTLVIPVTLLVVPVVRSADTGWQSPSGDAAGAAGDGDGFEVNSTGAYADGGDYASNEDGREDSHFYYDFGFDSSVIPTDAVIAGIEVRVDGWADSTDSRPEYQVWLSWDAGSHWSQSRRAILGADSAILPYYVLGGPSDLWGHAWSASELSDANFRVGIQSKAWGDGMDDRDFFLDWVAVRVTYASAHIGGTIWADENANGIQDGTEAGLSNVHVTIYQDDGDSVFEGGGQDLEVGSDDTSIDGAYDTGPFKDGYSYWIDVDAPANHYLTTPPVPRLVSLPDGSSVTVNFGYAALNPNIEIAKTPDSQTVTSGSTADFTIIVTNTGDVRLDPVTVNDVLAPDCSRNLGSLESGASIDYSCSLANVTDGFINSATATGRPPVGDDVTDADAAKVRLDDALDCPTDMIAYWRLEEASGPTYDDYYDGLDGQCAGRCPVQTTGHIGWGQVFNGSDTGIDVPAVPGDDSFNWGAADSFSIEFWLQTDSASTCAGSQVIVGRDDSASSLHWWVGCVEDGQAYLRLTDTGGGTAKVKGTTDLTDGAWHHVVAVHDAGAHRIRIYVDGTEENSTDATYTNGFDSSTAALNIGWLDVISTYNFEGRLDEMAVYDRMLSPDEVRQHNNEGIAGRWYCQTGKYSPVIVSTPLTEATTGRPYRYDVEAVGDPAPTYTLLIGPTGMTIDQAAGLISWTPVFGQTGTHDVQVQASNSEGVDTQSFAIEVAEGTICPTDMIAYWRLEEASGPTYDDFYDGLDGQCANPADPETCPEQAPGHIGWGQVFNGGETGIDVPVVPGDDSFNWGKADSFSVEFWLRTESASTCAGNQVFVGRDDSASDLHWWVGCVTGGQINFRLTDTGGGTAGVSGPDLTDGAWHHVVAVHDAGVHRISIYVDGTEEDWEYVTYANGFDSSTAALNIGWLNLSDGFHFDGILDEVALYDDVLPTSLIEHHYNNREASPGYCINPDIAIEKTPNSPMGHLFDTVIYSYTVTNPGDDPLSNVDLSDDQCLPVIPVGGDNDGDDELDLGESWTYTCSMILNGDITNTAIVTGAHSLGGTVNASDTVSVDVITPAIKIAKSPDSQTVDCNSTVTFSIAVTNTGDVLLDPVTVSDVLAPDCSRNLGSLASGASIDYTCSATNVTASFTNTATVTGTPPIEPDVSDFDAAFVKVLYPIYLPTILSEYETLVVRSNLDTRGRIWYLHR